MNLESIYYFVEVTKDMNITKTAQRLYMSQQTLSNHIKRLEEYYELPFFYRKPKLSLTYAGEIFLNFAKTALQKENNLRDLLADIKKETNGLIRFGASTLRSSACLPSILEKMAIEFPDVRLRLTTNNSNELEHDVLEGNLDLAMCIESERPSSELNFIPLMEDPIYLCVTDKLLVKYYGDDASRIKEVSRCGADITNFSKLPFCLMKNRVGENIYRCFTEANIVPKLFATNSNIQITTSFGVRGLAAVFASKVSLYERKGSLSSDLNIFPLLYQGKPLIQNIYLFRRKDRYISSYMDVFITHLVDFHHNLETLDITDLKCGMTAEEENYNKY